MKYFKYSPILFFLLLFFVTASKNHTALNTAIKTNEYYKQQLYNLHNELLDLSLLSQIGVSENMLIPKFLSCRETFKKTEYFLTYMDNIESAQFNGANIIINEYDSIAPMEEQQPHGLQVIEDLIYNPTADSRTQLIYEIKLLDQLVLTYLNRNKKHKVERPAEYNMVMLDALRKEVYRIESMGITGFDVPDSENSLPETIAALQSIRTIISYYEPLFDEFELPAHYLEGDSLIENAIVFIEKNNDFDSFDRLTFMSKYLHPLSKWLKISADKLGYIFPSNVEPLDRNATFLFDENIWNKNYFAANSTPYSIALGKKLFNETLLSANNSRSCASCHNADMGFADGLVKNISINGDELLLRNTPSLWNAGLQTSQFYDSRVKKLEKQSLAVIHNELEMGGNLIKTIDTLKQIEAYQTLFDSAYNGYISEYNIVNALADYIETLIAFDSRFDQYMRGDENALTASEMNGFNLFAGKAKCATCHFMPFFNGLLPPFYTDTESEILGVPADKNAPSIIDPDKGKYLNTRLQIHKFSFKTPNLRNVEYTAPYMHNGVFETLEEVVEFYNQGGGAGQGMDLSSQTLPSEPLHLTDNEINDIVNFMKSLSEN